MCLWIDRAISVPGASPDLGIKAEKGRPTLSEGVGCHIECQRFLSTNDELYND